MKFFHTLVFCLTIPYNKTKNVEGCRSMDNNEVLLSDISKNVKFIWYIQGLPWYNQTWFIVILFLLYRLVIPPIIGMVLVFLQSYKIKKALDERLLQTSKIVSNNVINMLNDTNEQNIKWCSDLKQSTIEYCKKMKDDTQKECEKIKEDVKNKANSFYDIKMIAAEKTHAELDEFVKNRKSEAEAYYAEQLSLANETIEKARKESDLLRKLAESTIKQANQIRSDANEYKRSIFEKYNKMETQTQDKCKRMLSHAEKECNFIRSRWESLKILLDDHYKEVQTEVNKTMLKIDEMAKGIDFEFFFAEIMRTAGYDDVKVTKGSGDKGADIIAEKEGIKYAIQCKRYKNLVDTAAVQEALSGKAFYHCHIAIVVTNNRFTDAAKELAENTEVILWDRKSLKRMVFDYCRTLYIRQYGISDYPE